MSGRTKRARIWHLNKYTLRFVRGIHIRTHTHTNCDKWFEAEFPYSINILSRKFRKRSMTTTTNGITGMKWRGNLVRNLPTDAETPKTSPKQHRTTSAAAISIDQSKKAHSLLILYYISHMLYLLRNLSKKMPATLDCLRIMQRVSSNL